MSTRTSFRSNKSMLRCILLLGVTAAASGPAIAQEPTSVNDRISSRLTIKRRTDANAQKDIAAAKAFSDSQTAQSSISIGGPATEPEAKSTSGAEPAAKEASPKSDSSRFDLPTYGVDGTKDNTAPEADDAATTAPALGSTKSSTANGSGSDKSSGSRNPALGGESAKTAPDDKPSAAVPVPQRDVTSTPIIEGFEDCSTIIYEPVMDACDDEVITQRVAPAIVPASPSTASSTVTMAKVDQNADQWSDKNLVDKINRLGDGALQIGSLEEAQPVSQVVTSGYRYERPSSSQPSNTILDLGLPVYSRAGGSSSEYLTSVRPATYLAGYAQDAAASDVPSLSSSDGSGVVPAAFQSQFDLPAGASGTPVMPNAAPSVSSPPAASSTNTVPAPNFSTPPAPLYNSGSGTPLSGGLSSPPTSISPSATIQPSLGGTSSVPSLNTAPSGSIPYDTGNPQYAPRNVISGEPFVTQGPCQFDAYQMVTPVSYNMVQNTAPNYCTPWSIAAPAPYPQPAAAPAVGLPGYIAPPTAMPTAYGTMYSNAGVAHRPLFRMGQQNRPYQVGQGIIGQPVAYVPGQRFRNFFRYFFP